MGEGGGCNSVCASVQAIEQVQQSPGALPIGIFVRRGGAISDKIEIRVNCERREDNPQVLKPRGTEGRNLPLLAEPSARGALPCGLGGYRRRLRFQGSKV